jgi:hypothetical protein
MRIATYLSELDVPTSIETRFRDSCEKKGLDSKTADMRDFISEEIRRLHGKMAPKDEAIFLSTYHMNTRPGEWGYPVEGRITFEDRGVNYTTVAFGWASRLKGARIYMIAYREP